MNFYTIGALSGALVVMLGAFGAHGLKEVLDEYSRSIYEKAVLYQMLHTVAILILGVMEKVQPQLNLQWSGWAFVLGIILFSGSLYLLAILGTRWLGAVTPLGGIFFILGWALLFFKTIKTN